MREIKLAQRGVAWGLLLLCGFGPSERLSAAISSQKPIEWALFWFAVLVVAAVCFVVAPVAGGSDE